MASAVHGNLTGTKAGGITDIDIHANSEEVDKLARFAVNEYNKKENALLEYKHVLKAQQQVVAGTIYYITLVAVDGGKKKIYEAKIWVKPWENFKELQEFKFIADVDAKGNAADAKAGGITDIDIHANSEEVDELARFAVNEYNKKENALLEYKHVLKAQQQVVEGILYYITLVAVDSGKKKIYEAKIWVKPWENFKQLQDFKFIADVQGSNA